MIIRNATVNDYASMLDKGEIFWSLTEYVKHAPYVRDDVKITLDTCMEHDLLLVAEDDGEIAGFVGGIAFPLYANTSVFVGQELFWWVEPQYRKVGVGNALLDAVEARAKEKGLLYWSMMFMSAVEPEVAKQVYLKRGYKETEVAFAKEL